MASTMSSKIVDISGPCELAEKWCMRVEDLLQAIPGASSHLTHEIVQGEVVQVVGSFEGATPEGYRYAPGSEDELREAAGLLKRAAAVLQRVRAREWTRSGNEGQP